MGRDIVEESRRRLGLKGKKIFVDAKDSYQVEIREIEGGNWQGGKVAGTQGEGVPKK